MLKWSPYPFVRYTVLLISGILVGELCHNADSTIIAGFTLTSYLIYFMVAGILKRNSFTRFRMLIGFIGLTSIFLTGLFRSVSIHEKNRSEEIRYELNEITSYSAWITTQPVIKNGSIRFEALITNIQIYGKWVKENSSVSIYYKADLAKKQPAYGDKILVSGNPDIVKPPSNQYVFNYQKWLYRKGILYQDFIEEGAVTVYNNDPQSNLMQLSYRLRDKISHVIQDSFDDPVTSGIVSALVIGQRTNLDPGVANNFSRSGVYHILAVSGLHVGIIYLILVFFFGRLNQLKPGRWVFAMITISTLTFYSMITGLSPSVIRAATMLSMIPLSQAISRQANIFNTISFSAFTHLLINPFLLFSAGFQLSYLAVLGILIFYKPIYNVVDVNSWLLDRIWRLWSVSIAAQIVTFPVSIYYFNQFPVVFLLSNIVMIPVAFTTVVSGFLLLVVHSISFISDLVSTVIHYMITSARLIIQWLNSIQGDIFSNIPLSGEEVVLLYFLLLFITLLFSGRKIRYLYLSAAILLSFTIQRTLWIYANKSETKLMVYYLSGNRAIEFVQGLSSFLILEEDNRDNDKILENLIYPVSRNQSRTVAMNPDDAAPCGIYYGKVKEIEFYVWQSKKIAVFPNPERIYENPGKIIVDVVIINNSKSIKPAEISKYIQADHWILSGWISDEVKSAIDSLAHSKQIKIHYPGTRGFSEISL